MATAMTLIGAVTLTSAQSSVTFANIPQNYRDLKLTILYTLSGTSAGDMLMSLNNDTGVNYYIVEMSGNGATTTSSAYTRAGYELDYRTTTTVASITVDVMDYSATDKHKLALLKDHIPDTGTTIRAVKWANTSAVTSFTCSAGGTTWAIGSTFYLYGVQA
jgi:hypothetical protein